MCGFCCYSGEITDHNSGFCKLLFEDKQWCHLKGERANICPGDNCNRAFNQRCGNRLANAYQRCYTSTVTLNSCQTSYRCAGVIMRISAKNCSRVASQRDSRSVRTLQTPVFGVNPEGDSKLFQKQVNLKFQHAALPTRIFNEYVPP